jgi:hypothetical protein
MEDVMHAYALNLDSEQNNNELFCKIHCEMVNRYGVDPKLASEMAIDLMEVISAVDGNLDIFEKYFLH